jgi:plasmid stability protein
MAKSLLVRDVDDELVERLESRAARHNRSPEAEHREILRQVLTGARQPSPRAAAAARLAEFRRRTADRGSAATAELLRESRECGVGDLAGGSGA